MLENIANEYYLKDSILKETKINAKISVTHYSPTEERNLCSLRIFENDSTHKTT